MPKPSRLFPALLALVFGLFAAESAQAQGLTRGVRLPMPSVALGDDAMGIDVNPAGIGFLRAPELAFVATELSAGVPGSGQAGYFALPLPAHLSLGFAYSHLESQASTMRVEAPFIAPRFSDFGRLSFALALSPSPRFSFGLSVHHLLADEPSISGLTTVDLGVTFRPSRWLSFGAAVRDLGTPTLSSSLVGLGGLSPVAGTPAPGSVSGAGATGSLGGGTAGLARAQTAGGLGGLGGLGEAATQARRARTVNRSWVMGVGVRPGTERLFIGAEVAIEEVARHVDPSVRLVYEVLPGLGVGGHVGLRDRDGQTELTAQLGLSWNFDLAPVRGALSYASNVEKGQGHEGVTVGARIGAARERSLTEPKERFLQLRLQGGIPESAPSRGLFGSAGPKWTHASAVLALKAALRDERVRGVLIGFEGVSLGLAQAEELRDLLLELRRAGKRVVAHVEGSSNATYLAASAAERLYFAPVGSLNTVGFAASTLFLRGLLDKIGILPEFIAAGRYKSAPEQLTRKDRSAPAREATTAFLNDAMGRLVAAIAENRKRSADDVRAMIDKAPLSAGEAVQGGWVDDLAPWDEVRERAEKALKTKIAFISDVGAPAGDRWGGYDAIAVVHVEGAIVDGKSGQDPLGGRSAGAETIVRALRAAKADPRVRAVVLRVNSPGGSVTASERILREVMAVKKRKPVVASYGNLAASGGYYISCAANEILAEPTTLTGSIGVFFGKAAASELLAKGDVREDTIKTARHADLMTFARPWTDEERALLTKLVKVIYRQFLDHVVAGRRLPLAHVKRVAEGRIWSGKAALGHKLVDRLGGLADAIERAKLLAKLRAEEKVAVVQLPRPTLLSRLLSRLGVEGRSEAGPLLQAARRIVPGLWTLSPSLLPLKEGEPWAILPFEIDLR